MNNVLRHVLTKPWSSDHACFSILSNLRGCNKHGSQKVIPTNNAMSERVTMVLSRRYIRTFDSLSWRQSDRGNAR